MVRARAEAMRARARRGLTRARARRGLTSARARRGLTRARARRGVARGLTEAQDAALALGGVVLAAGSAVAALPDRWRRGAAEHLGAHLVVQVGQRLAGVCFIRFSAHVSYTKLN